MSKIEKLFEDYLKLCQQDDVVGCGDLVQKEDDETCKALYEKLSADERTKDKLVKPLWYNYQTQSFRW